MSDVAETLDPLRLPLQGERLIEASAGTGKTFTIAALYLRLLLGLGGSAAFPRPLTVEELLVVTFTEAATAELRGRIRSNIHELRIACLRETTDNPLYERLLEEIDDKAQAAQWLLLAERQMDEAAVFTIHGFCQRTRAGAAGRPGRRAGNAAGPYGIGAPIDGRFHHHRRHGARNDAAVCAVCHRPAGCTAGGRLVSLVHSSVPGFAAVHL